MIFAVLFFIIFSNIVFITSLIGMEELTILFACIAAIPFFFFNAFPSFRKFPLRSVKDIQRGVMLLIEFLITCVVDVIVLASYFVLVYADVIEENTSMIIWNSVIAWIAGVIIFWNGIIRVYITSKQLGVKWRVIGAVCGMIPIAHLVALGYIIRITSREYREEDARYKLNKERESQKICATKYPLLMVHGVFFRDFRFFNYWGRIPEDLIKNGAQVYYGNQQSAASVAECGKEIAARIKEIVDETGCGKVNIIAHSKGGLDSRAAITMYGMAPYVASLTTVNTPHRGCQFADYLLSKAPQKLKDTVAGQYNGALKRLGDKNPDFLAAVTDLTNENCKAFNENCPNDPGVYYQSIGSKSVSASGGRFPLNMSYHLVNLFDGPNDGLVAMPSMQWGSDFTTVTPLKKRGITHGDMIDLNRENIDGFDVREAYVQLVGRLKEKGF